MQLVYGSKPKTRIQMREMRADSCTCALLGKKAAPGWTTAPKACRRGGSVMQLETKNFQFLVLFGFFLFLSTSVAD